MSKSQILPVSIRLLPKDAPDSDVDATSKIMRDAFQDCYFIFADFDGYLTHTEAFFAVKSMSIYLGGHRELTLEFVSSVVKAGVIGGEVYVAEDASGAIVGASVWFTPGQNFLDSEEQRSAGYDKIMAKLAETSPKMSAWWTEYFNRHAAETFKNAFGDSHYGVNCWHLYLVGVQPSLQRRGIATTLMDDAEARIRAHPESNEHARTIILGTSTDGKFYEKRGFTKKGEFDVKSIEELNKPLTTRYYSKIVE